MALTVPGRQTVTVTLRTRQQTPDGTGWARDSHGNAVYADEQIQVPGCSVQPGSTTETDNDGQVRVTSVTTIYAPPSWPGGPIDSVAINGARFEIQGRPERHSHPRLSHVVVTVQEVTS